MKNLIGRQRKRLRDCLDSSRKEYGATECIFRFDARKEKDGAERIHSISSDAANAIISQKVTRMDMPTDTSSSVHIVAPGTISHLCGRHCLSDSEISASALPEIETKHTSITPRP